MIKSLLTPPVTTTDHPPHQNPSTSPKRKSKLGFLTLTDQKHSKIKSSKDAKDEAEAERSVAAGILAEPKPISASLDSRKSSDSKKGNLQTATMTRFIDSSDLGATHTPLVSLTPNHLSFSQKDDILSKGLVVSVGDNTPITDATSLATDPGQTSSITAPTVNVSPQSQGEIQVEPSVSNDPLAKTHADDDEEASSVTKNIILRAQKIIITSHANIKGEKSLLMAFNVDDVADDVTDNVAGIWILSRGRNQMDKKSMLYAKYGSEKYAGCQTFRNYGFSSTCYVWMPNVQELWFSQYLLLLMPNKDQKSMLDGFSSIFYC